MHEGGENEGEGEEVKFVHVSRRYSNSCCLLGVFCL